MIKILTDIPNKSDEKGIKDLEHFKKELDIYEKRTLRSSIKYENS